MRLNGQGACHLLAIGYLSLLPFTALAQDASQINTTGNAFYAQCVPANPSYTACLFYVIGLSDGLNLVNATLQNFGQKEMFCVPSGTGFHGPVTGVQAVDLMMRYMQRHPEERHKPTMLVLVNTFKETFPCR
jgi:hypothetical protein